MLKQKKGIALNQAFGAILTIVLIAVLVIIAIVLFVTLKGTFVNLASASATNESVDMSLGGPVALGNSSLCNVEQFAISEVFNSTGTTIADANYTVTSGGLITNTTNEFPDTWLVSSSSSWGGEACVAGDSMIVQFATYPVLIGLVGTILFLGLVIGVLVASFAFGGRNSGV